MSAFIRTLIFAGAFLGFMRPAYAGIHLEPFLGYYSGDAELQSQTEDIKGTDMGLRAGFGKMGFSGGLEYSIGKFEVDDSNVSDLEPTNLGVFASFQFPVLIQVYASYIFQSKTDFTVSNVKTELEGKGTRLGVGFTGLPFVSINLEYVNLKYDECDASGIDCSNSIDPDVKMYGVSVSVPLDL